MRAYFAGQRQTPRENEEESEEGDDQEEEEEEEAEDVPADDDLLTHHVRRRERFRKAPAHEAPSYFTDTQMGLFERLDAMATQMDLLGTSYRHLDNRIYTIEQHLTRYTGFSAALSSSQHPPDPKDPNY